MSQTFPGQRILNVLESEMKVQRGRVRKGLLPVRAHTIDKEVISIYHIEEVCGYRGTDPRVYYLSPWEFIMFWEVIRVPVPNTNSDDGLALSQWTGVAVPRGSMPRPGIHYVANDDALSEQRDYIALPKH